MLHLKYNYNLKTSTCLKHPGAVLLCWEDLNSLQPSPPRNGSLFNPMATPWDKGTNWDHGLKGQVNNKKIYVLISNLGRIQKMEVVVLKAQLGDMETLNKISVESKMHWNYPVEWLEQWIDDLRLTENDFLTQEIYKIEKNGLIIGFCSIQEKEQNYEITHLWIRPDYIGRGYGKILLNQTITNVVKKEKEIIVEADPNAEQFYKSQGFVIFSKVESFPKGRFLPVMKKLPPINRASCGRQPSII
jgi:N-acetylglutamate synthase-like GNAT family acetyltransferase